MYVCLECMTTFHEPMLTIETHGLDTPPYEQKMTCPYCGGTYSHAYQCDCCEKYIVDNYIKTNDGRRYCENCFVPMDLGEEKDD